ncbi:hypothetical protein Lal_00003930 [Lupinus albus]|nr:hypothetical protein Lal_00003930 [Lupinus albus]
MRAPPCSAQLQIEQYCSAHIIYIIGEELFPDKSNNRFTDIAGVQLVWITCIERCVGQQNRMQRPWVGSNERKLPMNSTWGLDGI